jgi:hypothetical protein
MWIAMNLVRNYEFNLSPALAPDLKTRITVKLNGQNKPCLTTTGYLQTAIA